MRVLYYCGLQMHVIIIVVFKVPENVLGLRLNDGCVFVSKAKSIGRHHYVSRKTIKQATAKSILGQ